MKGIFGCGLLVAFASFGLHAAENDLCSSNIQRLTDTMNSAATVAPDVKNIVTERIADAKKAQASGDTKECIDITTKAIEKLELYKK